MNWTIPSDWMKFKTIESHAAGEPLRVILEGWPPIPGNTILAKRRYAREHHDHLRRALIFEPRGHADMYGAIMTEPVTPDGDLGVLFLHNEGFSTMCGHGIIALVTVMLETGMMPAEGDSRVVRLDTPAGRVTARANLENGRVTSVAFENVPSYVYARDQRVNVPGIGDVRYDVMFGGAFYAYCNAAELSVGLGPEDIRALIILGTRVKRAVMDTLPIRHPFEPDLGFLYGTIIYGAAREPGAHSRNVCIFADGEVDRSPTGTGVSGRVALQFAKGNLKVGEPFTVESIIGTRFTGRVTRVTRFGEYDAVIPEIEGTAGTVGQSEFWIDPRDAVGRGFVLR